QVFHFSGIFMNIARSADLFKPNLPGSSFLDKADSVTMGANSMSGNMDHPDKRDMLFSGTDAFIADQFEVSNPHRFIVHQPLCQDLLQRLLRMGSKKKLFGLF